MSLAITEEQVALERTVRDFLTNAGSLATTRALLDGKAVDLSDQLEQYAKLGWLGLPVDPRYGGEGFGLLETAIVVEQMAAQVTPGLFLPTIWASALLDAYAEEADKQMLLPGLTSGQSSACVGLDGAQLDFDGLTVRGDGGLVLGGQDAQLVLVAVGDDVLVLRSGDVTWSSMPALDPSRPLSRLTCGGSVQPLAILSGARPTAIAIGRVLAAAEASGVARACVTMARDYALQRVAFGRPIGAFQAVKHHVANMLVDTELASAAVWAACQAQPADSRSAAVAAGTALPAGLRAAQRNIQVHGAIGYTWEHDAHLFLRRAATLSAVFGPAEVAFTEVLDATLGMSAPSRSAPTVALPEEAEEIRARVREFRAGLPEDPADVRAELLSSGYGLAHWPKPWGRAAGPVEQIVIEQELDGLPMPAYGIGEWILLTVIAHGTPEQVEALVPDSLAGKYQWCQLFSEPDAGSDAAAIRTRARQVDGGWIVNGQKTWTSGGRQATHGLATIRTDPDAPKHAGVTMMIVDMSSPGVDVRPIRDITGQTHLNEVYFDDVFVPDDRVLGEVHRGWAVARSALGAERVTIGRERLGLGVSFDLLDLYRHRSGSTPGMDVHVGALITQDSALAALTAKVAQRAVAGREAGPEGNVLKLVGAEHAQSVADAGVDLVGVGAGLLGPDGTARSLLEVRFQTISGGTSEIMRNQIGERILGLPRDPLQV